MTRRIIDGNHYTPVKAGDHVVALGALPQP